MKAHTQQPARKHQPAQQPPKDMWYVLGWLALPFVLAGFVVYKWRVAKARMGYRTVKYDN